MQGKILEYQRKNSEKRIAILGVGISNIHLLKFLLKIGANNVTLFDKADEKDIENIKSQFVQEFENRVNFDLINKNKIIIDNIEIECSFGANYMKHLKGFDIIFRTPIMRVDIPEILLEQSRGAEITSEIELVFELCEAQIYGITGSDGKTTTSTIVYNMFNNQGFTCWLGGNIGVPLISCINKIKENHKVVIELSSFQLQTMKISPNVSIITNISPNHLDIHKSMQEYIDAKKNIFKFQKSTLDKLILNYDDQITKNFGDEAKGETIYFSTSNRDSIKNGVMLNGEDIIYVKNGYKQCVLKKSDILLPGRHNLENYMAAICAVLDCVSLENIKRVAKEFNGVEHRMEFVKELNGVKFYNDSVSSSPSRTKAGLLVFDDKIILITGGYDKNIPYDSLGDILLKKVKVLILMGQTSNKIEDSVKRAVVAKNQLEKQYVNNMSVFKCESLKEAVEVAICLSASGDNVLFSPASASFDMFKNFEDRGIQFKELVKNFTT